MKLRKIVLALMLSSPITLFASNSAEDITANDRVQTMCSLSGLIVNELVTMRTNNPDKFHELIENHKDVSADDITKQYIVDPFMYLGLWVDDFDANTSADIGLSYKKMCAEDNLFI